MRDCPPRGTRAAPCVFSAVRGRLARRRVRRSPKQPKKVNEMAMSVPKGWRDGRRCARSTTGPRSCCADRRCRRRSRRASARAQPAQGADRIPARQSAQSAQAVFRCRARRARPTRSASAGIIQPIVVRSRRRTDSFEIIAGERRWRAAQRAGLHEVPIVVLDVGDGEALELAIIENVQRADLNRDGRGARLSVARGRIQSLRRKIIAQDRRQEPQPCRQHDAPGLAPAAGVQPRHFERRIVDEVTPAH